MTRSYVVTGAARGIGRSIALRLAADGHVVAVDSDARALAWTDEHRGIAAVAGDAGAEPVAGALAYATAKAAVEGLTRALAVDYGAPEIRANAVALGSIATGRLDGLEEELRRLHPLGRVGRPEEVADVVGWLLSPQAGFVSGAIVPVDAGRAVLGRDPEARDVTGA